MARGRGPLRIALENWIDTYGIADRVRGGLETVAKIPLTALQRTSKPFVDRLLSMDNLPEEYRTLLQSTQGTEPISMAVILTGVIMGAIMGLVSGMMRPISNLISQWMDTGLESARADPVTGFKIRWRNPQLDAVMEKHARQHGWDEPIITAFGEIARPRLGIAEMTALVYRGEMTQSELSAEMLARGYTQEDATNVAILALRIPGVGDLVSMAVREAWSDDIAGKFGYDQDLSPDFIHWMEKQGISADWAKKYWRAHWRLPGINDGQEMLHRGIIDEATFAELLKISDYPAFWRKALTEMSYTPFTRVDVRRMYDLGIIETEAELVVAYQDIGYSTDKATDLMHFTVALYGEAEREATKGDILTAYEVGRFSHSEATEWLQVLGYKPWITDTYLYRIDVQRENEMADEIIKNTQTLYVNGQISSIDVTSILAGIPLEGSEITNHLTRWEIARKSKIQRPSRTDLKGMFFDHIIDEDQYRKELAGHGLDATYISWFVQEAKLELAKAAIKVSEAAKKELARLQSMKKKDAFDIAIAEQTILIAEANVAIADLKLWMTEVETMLQLDEAKKTILQYKAEIARYNEAKANLRKIKIEALSVEE